MLLPRIICTWIWYKALASYAQTSQDTRILLFHHHKSHVKLSPAQSLLFLSRIVIAYPPHLLHIPGPLNTRTHSWSLTMHATRILARPLAGRIIMTSVASRRPPPFMKRSLLTLKDHVVRTSFFQETSSVLLLIYP